MVRKILALTLAATALAATPAWSSVGPVSAAPADDAAIMGGTLAQDVAQEQLSAQFAAPVDPSQDVATDADWSRTMVRECVRVGDRMTC